MRSQHYFRAAIELHGYLARRHWTGYGLVGPDPGIRLNYRVGRFLKSYLGRHSWNDDYYYLQAQGYWTLANWRLFDCTGDERYRELAVRDSIGMLACQRDDGAWPYPNVEWQGRVATAEGTWGSIGLLESYRQTGETQFLSGALRWHRFLHEVIGFQRRGGTLAVNYFADRHGARIPNNAGFVLRFLAELSAATRQDGYRQPCTGLLAFMRSAQLESGELPYAVEGAECGEARPHFQCYQYNAFQCLDLARYYELTCDTSAVDLLRRVLSFLATGIAADGHGHYDCRNTRRAVVYHAAAAGAAFADATRLGIASYGGLASRALDYVLGMQRSDGGFSFSQREHAVLRDRGSYPRYLAMILYHLLLASLAGRSDEGWIGAARTGEP